MTSKKDASSDKNLHHCSFCGKSQNEVDKLVSGSYGGRTVFICNDCIAQCTQILEEGDKGHAAEGKSGSSNGNGSCGYAGCNKWFILRNKLLHFHVLQKLLWAACITVLA